MQNRLYHVNDAVATGLASNEDVSDPGYIFTNNDLTVNIANNFSYDEIGNLNRDSSEGIKHIEWTVTGKVKSITRYDGFSKTVNQTTIYPSDLEFLYDVMGNRITKIEKTRDINGLKPVTDWKTTYYVRDAQGNIMSVYKLSSEAQQTSFVQAEVGIYGSSMLGIYKPETELISAIPQTDIYSNYLGKKHFTGSNHLGNTFAVFSDIKHQSDYNNDNIVDSYTADLLSANDYAPFGGLLTERTFNKGTFPNTFNGKRDDPELSDWQDYGMRMYSPWARRFPTIDPLVEKYPSLSPYAFCGNNPIILMDPDGREPIKPFAGTIDGFMEFFNNLSSGIGNSKGTNAHQSMLRMGEVTWSFSGPSPKNTGPFNTCHTGTDKTKGNRYIYTENGGWIDMAHFMFYAGKAYDYKQAKQLAQESLKKLGEDEYGVGWSIMKTANMNPVGEAIQDEYMQEYFDQYGPTYSAYSYEDLPSDKFGADFGANYFDPNSKQTFGEQLQNYFTNVLKATNPENAPNYKSLPSSYPPKGKKPSVQNLTTKPMFISE